jgi:Flp pilus assembly protein TadG
MRGRRSRLGWRSERGQALVEAALITPVVLLIMVGIFEVARAYQTFQVLTNAAREGARAAVVPGADVETVKALVKKYMDDGQIGNTALEMIDVNQDATIAVNGTNVGATLVTVDYPFTFMMLQPVARLVVSDSNAGSAMTMRATSLMRNEAQ